MHANTGCCLELGVLQRPMLKLSHKVSLVGAYRVDAVKTFCWVDSDTRENIQLMQYTSCPVKESMDMEMGDEHPNGFWEGWPGQPASSKP